MKIWPRKYAPVLSCRVIGPCSPRILIGPCLRNRSLSPESVPVFVIARRCRSSRSPRLCLFPRQEEVDAGGALRPPVLVEVRYRHYLVGAVPEGAVPGANSLVSADDFQYSCCRCTALAGGGVGALRSRWVRPVHVRAVLVRLGGFRLAQVRPDEVRTGQVRIVQVRPGQVRAGTDLIAVYDRHLT